MSVDLRRVFLRAESEPARVLAVLAPVAVGTWPDEVTEAPMLTLHCDFHVHLDMSWLDMSK